MATLVWKKNGKVISNGIFTTPSPLTSETSANLYNAPAVSTLQILPTLEDHKAVVGCKAFSPSLPNESLEDEITLNVLCKFRGTAQNNGYIQVVFFLILTGT